MKIVACVRGNLAGHLVSALLGLRLASASAVTLPFHDPFDYPEGNLYTVAPGVWTAGGNAGPELAVSAAATLSAPVGLSGSAGKGLRWSPTGTARRSMLQFDPVSSGTLYASFLVNIVGPPSSARLVAYFDSSISQPSSPQLGFFVGNGLVGVGKKASVPTTIVAVGSSTHFIVVRYTFTGTSTDQVDFWVNPAATTFGAAGAPVASGNTTGGNNAASIPYFGIAASSGVGSSLYLDELRLGDTWAAVTPTDGTAPPTSGGVPFITHAFRASGNLVLLGTNGTPNGPYAVLSATSLALPVNQWPSLATNIFDGSGNFAATNPIAPAEAQRFYIIRSGTNTSPPAPESPEITDQPESLTVNEGQTATFSVAATGTSPLLYQWWFSQSPQAGATNATLTLANVTTNQAGDYFAIVTNGGGAATSIVATLTVTVPPPAPPVIVTQPQSVAVSEGGSAGFSVSVTGTAPFRYQWFFNTNTSLANATNAALVIANATTNDAGVYSVTVTNQLGATNSGFATLTVLPPATNPGPFQILQAEDATFTGKTDTQHSGYTGTGFVDTDNATGAYIEWEFGRQAAGTETVVFRYAHGKTDDRTASLSVNGVNVNGALAFPPTGAFTTWQTVTSTIPVVVGRNTLRLTALNSAGLANLDRAEVTGDPQFRLTTLTSGRGSMSLNPSNAFGYFNPGTLVSLTAVPMSNASFVGWSGALTGTNNPGSLTVVSNVSVTATFQGAQAFALYVATNGNDANPGTLAAPFYSLHAAVAVAYPGDVIYLLGGTYFYTNTVNLTAQNSSNNPIVITSYPGEAAVLDWSLWAPASETIRGGARGLKVTGSYWQLRDFTISYAPDNGIKCEGHHNTFERLVFQHNGDSGIQIGLNKEDYTTNPSPDAMAAHNLVLNCDSYRNADRATSYENADGFACKLYAGRGNRFYGCRAWENCDDGWDLYQTEYEIVIERCWAWHNGDPSLWGFSSFNGDGNSFKLGGDNTYCPVTVIQCVALDAQWGTTVGFAFNNNTAPITLLNCAALNCGRPYKFGQNGNIFKNCLDWNSTRPAPTDITGTSTQVNNSWNLSVTVTAADFVSVLASDAVAPRQTDGSLPNNGFARLVSGSDLIDQGVDVGLPFTGSAPDLGAYEFAP